MPMPPVSAEHTLPPFDTTATVDALVIQAAGLLEKAWRLARETSPGMNIDVLMDAHDACLQWLQEGE